MNFEEFREKLMGDLKESLSRITGEEIEVSQNNVAKLQNASYEGIVIRKNGDPLGLNLDATEIFKQYEKGDHDYGAILSKVEDTAINGFDNAPTFDLTNLTDYEEMKEHLSMQVVATDRNAEMLSNIPHKEIEDMSVVCRFVVSMNNDGIGTILVTNQILDQMGISEEQLFSDANKYAPDLRPGEIRGLCDVLSEMMGANLGISDASALGLVPDTDVPMYVATTHDKTNGAGIIAYPGFMEMAAEKVGGDFFLLPSSVHEVILIPDTGKSNFHDLESMVKEVNENQVPMKDRLSDHVYHYDSKEKVFELAEKFDTRKREKSAEKKVEKDSVLKDLSDGKKEAADTPRVKVDRAPGKDDKAL